MTALVRARADRDVIPLEVDRSWVALMAPAAELAKAIAPTEFVPRGLRNNPAAITAAILYGDEVGLGPMQSLSKIAVIDGRPFIAAEAQRALVYAAGHELWLEESSNTRATWAARRAGTDAVTRVTWTMDDARRAHLDGKPNWRSYPRAMLSARSSAELVRAVYADVIGGLAAIEELEDVQPDGATATGAAPAPLAEPQTRTRQRRRPVAVAAPAVTPAPPVETAELPPLPGEGDAAASDTPDATGRATDPEPLTAGQLRRLQALYRSRGYGGTTALDRARRHKVAEDVLGRKLASSNELTRAEADRVIDFLEGERPPESATPPDDTAAAPAADEEPPPELGL